MDPFASRCPFTDRFPAMGPESPGYDYSWLFDVFFAALYRAFGLIALRSGSGVRIAIPVCITGWRGR